MKYASALLLCAIVICTNARAQEHPGQPALTREGDIGSLIEEALARNPDIAVEFHKMEAAFHKVPQSGALDDPELVFKLMEVPGTRFNEAMYANIELMQMIPFPTKLATRRSLANLFPEHAHHDHMTRIVQIVADLKGALAMLWYGREVLSINLKNKEILQTVLKVTETSYTVGRASQQEVLRTNIELAKLVTDEATIQEQITTAEDMIRTILGRPAGAPVGLFGLGAPAPLPPLANLLMYAEQHKPMLIHDSLNVVEKEINVALMKQEYLPDFRLSVEYVRLPMARENRWSVSAGITLPFAPWTLAKASSRVEEAESEQLMLASMYASSKNMTRNQIRNAYASLLARSTELKQLDEAILPLLNQSIELLLTQYQTGTTSYMMLLDGYRMYNEIRRDRAMAMMTYHKSIAELERAVGVTDLTSAGEAGKEQQP